MADQFQYVKLPDGSYGKFASDASPEEMRAAVEKQFPTAYAPPTSGAVPGAEAVPDPINTPEVQNKAALWEGLKGIGKGVIGSVQAMNPVHNISEALGHPQGFDTTASNPDQMAGKVFEGAAELALPSGEGIEALPSKTRAAETLGRVAEAAKDVSVPMNLATQPLQRVAELGERGGVLPTSANALLKRSQMLGDMSFPEARDYYSNISSLSADEAGKLNSKMKSAVGDLRKGFHGDLTSAANTVGMGEQYANALKEYAQAMRLRGIGQDVLTKYLPAGGVLGAIGYGANKLRSMF